MNRSIGDNLKQMRLRKGLTQEQLAEVLNVSPQAVSRWENNTACPDISLLPGLAVFYDVTIDELMGMESVRKAGTLEKIHADAQSLVAEGKPVEAAGLLREGLRLYPGNGGLLVELAETLAHQAYTPEALDEAIRVSEQVLKNGTISPKARSTVSANLVFLCRKAGRAEKAADLARALPHFWESREFLEPEIQEGREYSAAMADLVRKILAFFSSRMEESASGIPGAVPDYIQLGFRPDRETDDHQLMEGLAALLEANPAR